MNLKFVLPFLTCGLIIAATQSGFAAGPHDMNCVECHSPHYAKGDYIIGVEPGSTANPASTRIADTIVGIDTLCLGCHNDEDGIIPIHPDNTHPTSVKPTYVDVPKKLLREGKFGCISCHNPHPSNTNYKYLVVSTNGGADMGLFCGVCHGAQSDPEVLKQVESDYKVDPPMEPRVKISK